MSAPYPDPPLMPGGRVCRAAAPRFFGTLMSPRSLGAHGLGGEEKWECFW